MNILTLDNVSLYFKGVEKPALVNINYSLKPGDFVIVLGSNGSGKSSLLKLLHRYHASNEGKIYFQDKPIAEHHLKSFSRKVKVLTQNCNDSLFSSLTLYENYLLVKEQNKFSFTKHHKEKRDLANYLSDFNPNLAHKLDAYMNQFSGGEKQAVALAFCLLSPPSLLLLDEHTSALDPKTSDQIMQLTQKMISKYHITCLLTTHDLDIAVNYGNRILMLKEGKIDKVIEKANETCSKRL